MNIVQGDGNAVFKIPGNPGSFKARPGKLRTLDKDCRADRDFILDPYVRISEVKRLTQSLINVLLISIYYDDIRKENSYINLRKQVEIMECINNSKGCKTL